MRFTHRALDRSTVSEVQKNITERRGKRNTISRLLHAKEDKVAIAAWKGDIDKILHIFNVRSVTSVRPSLNLCFQAELETNPHTTISNTQQDAANTHATVPDIHHDTLSPGTAVPDVHHNVTNTQPTVSNIHRNELKSHRNTGGQNQVVSTARTLSVVE